jgi:hypothetical protein
MRRCTADVDTPRYAAASRIENNSLRDNPLGLLVVPCAVDIGFAPPLTWSGPRIRPHDESTLREG